MASRREGLPFGDVLAMKKSHVFQWGVVFVGFVGGKVFDMVRCVSHNALLIQEGFPSGQRDQTVNLTALPSKVRILPPPPNYAA